MNSRLTIRQVIAVFERSSTFFKCSKSTQRFYSYGFHDVMLSLGEVRIGELRRGQIISLKETQPTPAKASRALASIKRLLSWCLDHEIVEVNVALGISVQKVKKASLIWSTSQIDRMERESKGLIRKVFFLGLYSAQRKSDLLTASWYHVTDGVWHLRQKKTSEPLQIPLSSKVLRELRVDRRLGGGFLVGTDREPGISVGQLDYRWRKTLKSLDLPAYDFHSLRVTRATQLAEAGCSPHEIASLTGHTSLRMVEEYTRKTRQAALVARAIQKTDGKH